MIRLHLSLSNTEKNFGIAFSCVKIIWTQTIYKMEENMFKEKYFERAYKAFKKNIDLFQSEYDLFLKEAFWLDDWVEWVCFQFAFFAHTKTLARFDRPMGAASLYFCPFWKKRRKRTRRKIKSRAGTSLKVFPPFALSRPPKREINVRYL